MNINEMYETCLGPGMKPREFQNRMWKKLQNYQKPQVLIASTGSGKTEAVVLPFLSQFSSNQFFLGPRLIYVLPTRAIADDLFQRLRFYAERISPKIKVELFHGTERPDMPVFMGDIVITTLDQFIYGYSRSTRLVGRHLDVPAGSIASSFVVFDEAHLYHSSYTFSHLRAMLEILCASKIPFCLMTATIPESLLRDLLRNCDYDTTLAEDPGKERMIEWELSGANLEDIIERELVSSEKVLAVLNTVKRSQDLYRKFKNRTPVLLHSRFFPCDRAAHTESVRKRLSQNGSGGLVISTQVLEAGVNVSADTLITEIAPADSLIQRIGRCARFGGQGKVVIQIPEQIPENSLAAPPYENDFIKTTMEHLQQNPGLSFTDFNHLRNFTNNLTYTCDDYQAQNSLIDLLQATMYADYRPQNLQIREGKSVRLIFPERTSQQGIYRANFNNMISIPYKSIFNIAEFVLFTKISNNKVQVFQVDYNELEKANGFKLNDKKILNQVNVENCLPGKIYLAQPEKYLSSEGLIYE
jgi:CRISPR-associated endonuclease/helicase Cas3